MDYRHDGDRLRVLLGGRNQAAFAREAGIPGGPSMVSQHLSGHRPVSVEAAIAYARGLGVPLDDVSPAAAELVRVASVGLSAPPSPAAPTLEQALAVVLGRLAGLDGYTADKVLGAMRAAIEGKAPREHVERDLLQWLQEPRPASSGKRDGTHG